MTMMMKTILPLLSLLYATCCFSFTVSSNHPTRGFAQQRSFNILPSYPSSVAVARWTTHTTPLFAGGSNDNDNVKWDLDSKPFDMLRHYSRKKVSNETLEELMTKYSIKALQDLKWESRKMANTFPDDDNSDLIIAITKTLEVARLTPEQVLCEEKIVYDQSCISRECYELYAPSAVSVDPNQSVGDKGDRHPEFTLVLGSSGSGKTLFAIRRVPELIFGGNDSEYFRIHFTALKVEEFLLRNKRLDFPRAAACLVGDVIRPILAREGHESVKVLDIPLHVTIDEAGEERFAKYFDTAGKIRSIHAAIVSFGAFRFQKVHVTVTGTGLDVTTAGILSMTDRTTKFRMRPWTAANFDALVGKSSNEDPNRVKEVVHGFPILGNLISNARCAYYVLRSMDEVSNLDKTMVESYVKVIVASVANSYIGQNGLKQLQEARQKWMVVRSVFRELDRATSQPDLAFFPEFKDLDDEKFRSIGSSLLDVNVESVKGKLEFARGNKYACSVSPAIAIVLIMLLSKDVALSWDWQAFESTVMLSELKQMIVDSQEAPSKLDKLILVLKSPVPEAEEMMSVSIPKVSRYTVMLNGPNAEYANVVAPYRLVKAKFTKKFSDPVKLNLKEELDKMGVTNSIKHKLQQFTSKVCYTMWETLQEVDEEAPPIYVETSNNTDYRFKSYPCSALSPRVIVADPAAIVGRNISGVWVAPKNTFGQDGVCKAFCKERPVTAVFATNGCEYRFKTIRNFAITPNDVDCDGKVKAARAEEFPAKFRSILSKLLDNVEIRFLFF